MRIFRRVSVATSVFAIAVSSLLSAFPAFATGNTCVWVGTSNGNFSTASNWTSCGGVAPQAADTISFGTLAGDPSLTLTNDLGHAVAGLIITQSSGKTIYQVDTLTLAGGATIDETNDSNGTTSYTDFSISGTLTAQGALTISGSLTSARFFANHYSIAGLVTIGPGANFDGANVSSSGIVVQNGAELEYTAHSANQTTGTYPITLGGGSGTAKPSVIFDPYWSSITPQPVTYTFANPLTLQGNAAALLDDGQITVNQTGAIAGTGFALSMDPNSVSGSVLNLSPSSNSSSTVPGKYIGTGAAMGGGHIGSNSVNTPAATPSGANWAVYQSLAADSTGSLNDYFYGSTSAKQDVIVGEQLVSSGVYYPIVEANFNLSSGNADLSGATLQTDPANHKALAHNFAQSTVGGVYTLFVPANANDKYVGVCPGAAALSVVAPGCANGFYLMNGGTYKGVTAKFITVGSQSYWKVSGLTGTGAYSSAVVPPNTGSANLSLGSVLTPIVAVVLTVGGIVLIRRRALSTSKIRR